MADFPLSAFGGGALDHVVLDAHGFLEGSEGALACACGAGFVAGGVERLAALLFHDAAHLHEMTAEVARFRDELEAAPDVAFGGGEVVAARGELGQTRE